MISLTLKEIRRFGKLYYVIVGKYERYVMSDLNKYLARY